MGVNALKRSLSAQAQENAQACIKVKEEPVNEFVF